eukprot:SAG11_NODE_464_length_9216_cov_131.568326_7_plen_70_part_00
MGRITRPQALLEAEAEREAHNLLLSEAWFRVALVYYHQLRAERTSKAKAHSAAVWQRNITKPNCCNLHI